MSYPQRASFSVPGTKYTLEVDVSKWDCNREAAHCHVCSGRDRIAQVWLSTCSFETIPSEISHNDRGRILSAVSDHRYELEAAYNNNRIYGAD